MLLSRGQTLLISHAGDADRVGGEVLRVVQETVVELHASSATRRHSASYLSLILLDVVTAYTFKLRLYGRDEIALLGRLDTMDDSREHGANVVRFRAQLRQTAGDVVVTRFSRPDSSYKAALDLSRRIW